MIIVNTQDEEFNRAYCNAWRALPIEEMETPKQYSERWRETYRCRVVSGSKPWPDIEYVFDNDEDYTWFMLQWA